MASPIAPKSVSASQVEMTELVLPNHTNQLGNLLGGQLMHWMDIAAAMAALRHSQHICVTAAVDEIGFFEPIHLGDIVILKASVNRVFRTSMEVGVKVFAQHPLQGTIAHANTAYLTFVSLDTDHRPIPAPAVEPQTEAERHRFDAAGFRRDARLRRREAFREWLAKKK
jgi:acyl-CoA hydrolase